MRSIICFKLFDGTCIKELNGKVNKEGEYQINSAIKLDDSDDFFIVRNIEFKHKYESVSDPNFDPARNPFWNDVDDYYAPGYITEYVYITYITVELDYYRHESGAMQNNRINKNTEILKIFFEIAKISMCIIIACVFLITLGNIVKFIAITSFLAFIFSSVILFGLGVYFAVTCGNNIYKYTNLIKTKYN